MPKYQLRPNNFALGREHDEITAIALGSGIAVCMYDAEIKTGGMIYTLFPENPESEMFLEEEKLRYVNTALDVLENSVLQAGARKDRLWAKIIGGARIFNFGDAKEQEHIGRQNVKIAREWLQKNHILIKSEDTGNNFGRTVHFFLEDGSVEVELVNRYKYSI